MGLQSVFRVRQFRSFGTVVLAVALVATGCSSDEVGDAETPSEASAEASNQILGGVSLETSTIEELDVVRFNGLDPSSDLSELELQTIVEGLDPMDMPIFADEIGVFAVAPFHPNTPGEGGPVTLRMTMGADESREFDIELSAIPKAPGAWDDAVASLLGELESRADQLGTSLAAISGASMADLDDDAAAVKFIAGFLDDGTDEDIGSLPIWPGAELSTVQAELVDSVVAKLGLGRMNLPPLEIPNATAMKASHPAASADRLTSTANAVRASLAQGTSCRKKVINITTGSDLQRELAKGIAAKNALQDGLFSDSSDYVVSNGLMLTGMAAGAFAATGVGAPAAGVVAGVGTVAGAMYATQRLALMVDAGSYPTSFASLNLGVTLEAFNEDFKKDGQVNKVDVVATATGMDGAEALAGLGAAVADGALGLGVGKVAGGLVPGATKEAAARTQDIAGGMMGISEPLRQTAEGKALKSLAGDTFTICPNSWTVPIKDSKYVRAWTVEGNIEVNTTALSYKPLKVGSDILWVETLPDAFPGASAINSVSLVTNRLEIEAAPMRKKVKKAGEVVDITAILENADTTTVWWDPGKGTWNDGRGSGGSETNDAMTRPLLTPKDKNLYPFEVIIESTSKTGLRADATDTRSTTVVIELRKLIVTPDPGGVLVENTLQFSAKDLEGQPREVKWKATGGEISSDGLYEAGKTPGSYTVTATATDDPNITETVTVNVVDKCLVGSWLLRSQEFFDQVSAQASEGEMEYRSGEHRLVIAEDGTFVGYRDAWTFEVATPEGKLIGVIDAENPGTWMATDTEIFVEESGGATESIKMSIEVGGQLMTIPGLGNEFSFTSEAYAAQAAYTCKKDVMTSTTDGVTSTFDRIGD